MAFHRPTEHMSRFARCRYYCREGATFLFSHIGLCGLVFGYTLVGAFTFEALEASHEADKRHQMALEGAAIVDHLWELTNGGKVLNDSLWEENATMILKDFETKLVIAMKKEGYDGNDESDNLQWSFSGALLYSIIVITTIGYGNIAPKTNTGKIVTILYAIVGIPLLLLCLSNIGDTMAHSFKFMYWKVCCYLCSSPKAPSSGRKGHSSRSSRYPSEPRSVALQGGRDLDFYRDSFDRQRTPGHQSLNRNTSYSSAREAELGDVHKVPIISNKYALHPLATNNADNQSPLHRINTMESFRHGRTVMRQPSNRLMQDAFLGLSDDLSFDDPSSAASDKNDDDDEDEEASVPIMLCLSIVVGYICGGAILFSYWEKWDYADSCYFCFITLTTIGFGDMVPGTAVLSADAQLALGLCSLYLLFGMALLAMSFNLVQAEVTKLVTSIGRRLGIVADEDDDEEYDM